MDGIEVETGWPGVKMEESEYDFLPEYCEYPDEGCEASSSCLDCPLPQCLYDRPRGRQRWLKTQRDRDIEKLFQAGEKGIKDLAVMFGVSQRTVRRALKKVKNGRELS